MLSETKFSYGQKKKMRGKRKMEAKGERERAN